MVGAGCVLARRGRRLVVLRDGCQVVSAPPALLSEVVLYGTVGVTTPALHLLLAEGIPLVLLRGDGRARGRLEPSGSPHVDLRHRQLARCTDEPARLAFSRAVVEGKIRNQAALLRRRARGRHTDALLAAATRIVALAARAADAPTRAALVGVEGGASALYFRSLRLLVDERVGFTRRDRHGPDVVNVLVNYCSALLREAVLGAVVAAGLDPYLSFLHEPMRARPTLAFDLMEEWRPVLLETTVLALVGLRAVGPADLTVTDEGPRLVPQAAAAAVERFRGRLLAPAHARPAAPEGTTYGDRLRARARAARDWVLDGTVAYRPFTWR